VEGVTTALIALDRRKAAASQKTCWSGPRIYGRAVGTRLERTGFYPAGGGRLCVEIEPSPDRASLGRSHATALLHEGASLPWSDAIVGRA
jgi:hypothetical protein